MRLSKFARNRKTQPRSAALSGPGKWPEQIFTHNRCNSRTVIANKNGDTAAFARCIYKDIAVLPPGLRDLRIQRLARIGDQIQQYAVELLRIGIDQNIRRNAIFEIQHSVFGKDYCGNLIDNRCQGNALPPGRVFLSLAEAQCCRRERGCTIERTNKARCNAPNNRVFTSRQSIRSDLRAG